ncbi:unknown [Parabacteroides merdae CAG:48]|nr:unknown [Parabacteroides merdae CAG:48]
MSLKIFNHLFDSHLESSQTIFIRCSRNDKTVQRDADHLKSDPGFFSRRDIIEADIPQIP